MSIERALFIFVGTMVFISGLLVLLHSRYWAFFTLFIGLNLVQSQFTGFCPPSWVMKKCGMKSQCELTAAQSDSK